MVDITGHTYLVIYKMLPNCIPFSLKLTVVVHNRRQKYMTNSLFDIGARAFGVETPTHTYIYTNIHIHCMYKHTVH